MQCDEYARAIHAKAKGNVTGKWKLNPCMSWEVTLCVITQHHDSHPNTHNYCQILEWKSTESETSESIQEIKECLINEDNTLWFMKLLHQW